MTVRVKIQNGSRLAFQNLTRFGGLAFWVSANLPDIEPQDDDISHVVSSEGPLNDDYLDQIAFTYYGTPNLWWVIAKANDVTRPDGQLFSGRKIVVPSPRYIRQTYLRLAGSLAVT